MRGLSIILLLLLSSASFPQSNDVKKDVFAKIEVFSRSVTIVKSKRRDLSYKDFIATSLFVPVNRYFYSTGSLDENHGDYVVFYDDVIFYYKDKKVSMYLRPVFPGVRKSTEEAKGKASFIYLLNDDKLDDLLFNSEGSYSESNGKGGKVIDSIIKDRYNSLRKFNESEKIILSQKNLRANDIRESIKSNYRIYERYCPFDTLLVVNSFISHVRNASIVLSDKQAENLRKGILERINTATGNYDRPETLYGVYMYRIDVLDVLLKVITKEDYLSFMEYTDVYYPLARDGKSRWMYGYDVLIKEGVIKDSPDSFGIYVREVVRDCGCHPDR